MRPVFYTNYSSVVQLIGISMHFNADEAQNIGFYNQNYGFGQNYTHYNNLAGQDYYSHYATNGAQDNREKIYYQSDQMFGYFNDNYGDYCHSEPQNGFSTQYSEPHNGFNTQYSEPYKGFNNQYTMHYNGLNNWNPAQNSVHYKAQNSFQK